MMSILPEYHAKYLLGHTFNSNHGQTTYQAPDRPIDVSGARFGETSYNGLSEYRSSVAWSRTEAQLEAKVTDERLVLDPRMAVLIQNVKDAERQVVKQYGCMSNGVTEKYLDDEMVVKAFNAWAECLERYQEMATEEDITRQFANISLSKPSRTPANAPSSSTHRPRQGTRLEAPMPVLKEPTFSPKDVQLGAPSKVRQVIALEDVEDAVMDALDNFDTSHPFISLIDNELHNPRHLVLMQYLGLAKKDELHSGAICPHCFANKTDPKVRYKAHNNYSQHVWGCEQSSTPNSWKCPVCAELLRCKGEEDWETKELELAFEEHCQRCRKILLIKCGQLDLPKDSIDVTVEEEEEEEEPADPDEKQTPLCMHSRVEGSRRPCTHDFCPLCLFDSMCSRPLKKKPFKAPELIYFSSKKGLREHLSTHWTNGKEAGILEYEHEYFCGFRNCDDTRLSTREMIEHLHIKHDYDLLLCTLNHEEHTEACFKLDDEFQWEEDAALRDKLNGTITSPVLVEARRKAVKDKARALIQANAGSSEERGVKGKARDSTEDDDSDSEEDDKAPRRGIKRKAPIRPVIADSDDDKAPRRVVKRKAPIRHVIADSTEDDDSDLEGKVPGVVTASVVVSANVDAAEISQDDSDSEEDDKAPRTPNTEHDLAYYIRQFDPNGSVVSQQVIDKMAEEELTLQLIAGMSAKDFKDLDMGLTYGRFKGLQTFITDVLHNGV